MKLIPPNEMGWACGCKFIREQDLPSQLTPLASYEWQKCKIHAAAPYMANALNEVLAWMEMQEAFPFSEIHNITTLKSIVKQALATLEETE